MITNNFSRSNKTYSTIYSLGRFNVEIQTRYIENKFASMIFFWEYKKSPTDFIKNRTANTYFNITNKTRFTFESIKQNNQQSVKQQSKEVIKLIDNYLQKRSK